jgi:RimJ/RimL family protein N-acetyltransferase
VRHDFAFDGRAFRLRPVAERDAEFIVELRRSRGRFLNRGADSIAAQLAWMAAYWRRDGDFYFVIERRADARREGLVGIYALDPRERTAEWGRWVLTTGSNAAIESVLLVYRCAFDALGLDDIRCRTLAEHRTVVSFHDSCGLERLPEPVTVDHDGERCAAVEHRLSRSNWQRVEARLDALAARLAAKSAAAAFPETSDAPRS